MGASKKKHRLLYAIYPNGNGFGYVYMKSPRKIIDHGVVRINPICNTQLLKRIKKSLEFLKPTIVLVLDPKGKYSRTGRRAQKLISSIKKLAKSQNLEVDEISRDVIRDTFHQFEATTKFEISEVLSKEFTELKAKKPYKRKTWMSEDRNMSIFDALSLAITWYYLNE